MKRASASKSTTRSMEKGGENGDESMNQAAGADKNSLSISKADTDSNSSSSSFSGLECSASGKKRRRGLGRLLSEMCGVEISMKEFNGPRVKSYNAHILADFCFLIPGMTPELGGTVFKRIGLHMQVFLLVVYSTAVFILAPVLLSGPNLGPNPKWGAQPRGIPRNNESTFQQGEYLSANLYVNQVLDIFGMLFSLLLSRYVYMVVQVHWIEARNKRGNLMRDTQLAINLILSHHRTADDHPDLDKQAKLFGNKMRCLLRLGPTMTVRYLEGKRKEELGRRLVLEDEVCSWSTWKSLEPMHKHGKLLQPSLLLS